MNPPLGLTETHSLLTAAPTNELLPQEARIDSTEQLITSSNSVDRILGVVIAIRLRVIGWV
jgi:hypothetical protein